MKLYSLQVTENVIKFFYGKIKISLNSTKKQIINKTLWINFKRQAWFYVFPCAVDITQLLLYPGQTMYIRIL